MSCRYISDDQWLQCLVFFDGECAYCGVTREQLTADHLTPKSKGGADTPSNIVPACSHCNNEKADQDWREYMMSKRDFCQARMNKVFDWRRICKQARLEHGGGECASYSH